MSRPEFSPVVIIHFITNVREAQLVHCDIRRKLDDIGHSEEYRPKKLRSEMLHRLRSTIHRYRAIENTAQIKPVRSAPLVVSNRNRVCLRR